MIKRLAFLIVSVMILCLSIVHGEVDYTAIYDSENELVKITGICNAREPVTLEVLYPGKTGSDAETATVNNFKETIYRINQTISDINGNFTFEFKMEDMPTGSYITRINAEDGEFINYINKADALEILTLVNNVDDTDDVILVLKNNKNVFGSFEKYFDNLSENARKSVAEEVIKQRDLESDKMFKDCNLIISIANQKIAVETLNTADNNLSLIVNDLESVFKLKSLEVYSLYEEQRDKNEILYNMVKNSKFESVEDIRNRFEKYTVLYAPKNMRYEQMYDLVAKYNHILNIDFSKYEKLNSYNKANVMRKIIGKAYDSEQMFKKAFDEAVSSVYDNTDSNLGGGSSGGGGGGSSGGGKPIGALVNQEENAKQDEEDITEPLSKAPFNDLTDFEWAKESIANLYQKGIINGKETGMFCPADYVKREEFVKMLVCAMGETTNETVGEFTDVDKGSWYAGYVNKASELGWVNGTGENVFGVGVEISRQDIATILYRILALKSVKIEPIRDMTFSDTNEMSEYAKDAVFALANAGIINGNSEGGFAPQRSATRAETAKLIDTFLKFFE